MPLARAGPETLLGKELYLWVTYPDGTSRRKKTKGKKAKPRRRKPSLWAVLIFEAIHRIDGFTFEVTLQKIYKREESTITIWIRNDPEDQSDEAQVFGFVSPPREQLSPLEQHLSQVAGKRVYDAVAEMWEDALSTA